MRKSKVSLEDTFLSMAHRLPLIGAPFSDLVRCDKKIRSWWFGPALFCLLILAYCHVEKETAGVIYVGLALICIILHWMTGRLDHMNNARALLRECKDAARLSGVAELSEHYPETSNKLARIWRLSDRNYLCWYEVLELERSAHIERQKITFAQAKEKLRKP